jgi:hypothetical protein
MNKIIFITITVLALAIANEPSHVSENVGWMDEYEGMGLTTW